jgi:hypothetical protein
MPLRFTVLFDTTVTDGSLSCTGFVYYNRRCSGIATMATFNPVDGLVSQLVGDVLYVPLGYWLQRYIPLARNNNGPVVNGVTLVLVVVAARLPTYHLSMRSMPLLPYYATVTDGSFTASIGLFTTTVAVAVSQFDGFTFNPVDGLVT